MNKKQGIVWIGLTAVLFCVRLFQLLSLTEPETGFLTRFDWSAYVFYILLAGGAALFALVGLKSDPNVTGAYPRAESTRLPRAILLFVMAVDVLIESVQSALTCGESLYRTLWLVFGGIGVLSALCLAVMGTGILRTGKNRLPAVLTLSVSLWLAGRALLHYLEKPYALTVPSLLLLIVSSVLLSVWWMEEARVLGGASPAQGQKLLNALTPVCVMTVFVSALPALIAGGFVPSEPVLTLQQTTTAAFLPYVILSAVRSAEVSGAADNADPADNTAPADSADPADNADIC